MEKKIHDKKKEDQGNFSIAILNFLKKKKNYCGELSEPLV